MKIHFLGVGGGVPSLKRALPAIAIYFKGKILLLDCGEGTQIQLQRAGLSLQKITEIFISHLHGDHILGLPGLLSSMAMLRRNKPLALYGPPQFKNFVQMVLELTQVELEFELTIQEVQKGIIVSRPDYIMECLPAIHDIPCFSFILRMADIPGRFHLAKARRLGIPSGPLRKRLQQGYPITTPNGRRVNPSDVLGPSRKGAIIAYSGDTAPNPELIKVVAKATLLIHDATFSETHAAKAEEFFHSTASQAAQIALQADVEKLALVHISPRYETSRLHVKEAKQIFRKSFAPKDFDIFEIKHS